MVAILENGRHFEILRGTRYFLNKGPKSDTHAKFGACITIWKIVSVICPTIEVYAESTLLPDIIIIKHQTQTFRYGEREKEQHG